MSTRTDQLKQGDRVRLPGGRIRTVDRIETSQFVNRNNRPILYVKYAEGHTAEWSDGNSAIDSSLWDVES